MLDRSRCPGRLHHRGRVESRCVVAVYPPRAVKRDAMAGKAIRRF